MCNVENMEWSEYKAIVIVYISTFSGWLLPPRPMIIKCPMNSKCVSLEDIYFTKDEGF